jgi:hypothetical protein
MPEICRFFGIVIAMYFNDHDPPHFHARYGGKVARIAIGTLAVLSGSLPPRVQGLVAEWAVLHREELAANWERLRGGRAARRIDPLQ